MSKVQSGAEAVSEPKILSRSEWEEYKKWSVMTTFSATLDHLYARVAELESDLAAYENLAAYAQATVAEQADEIEKLRRENAELGLSLAGTEAHDEYTRALEEYVRRTRGFVNEGVTSEFGSTVAAELGVVLEEDIE